MKIIEKYQLFLSIDKSYSSNTIDTYLLNINQFVVYCEHKEIDILNVEYKELLDYLDYLKKELDYKSKSLNTVIACLKSFYEYLLKEKYIANNPSSLLKFPKVEKNYPSYLTNDEINTLLSVIDTSKDTGKRNYLLIILLYDTGVRVSELLNIKLNDIDYENKTIKILGKGDKERLVYFTNDTYYVLIEYIKYIHSEFENHSNYLFSKNKGSVLSRNEVYNIIRKYGEDAKINKIVTPHVLRHSLATHMIQNDADVMSVKTILGHSNVSTTQIYTHLNKKDLKAKYDAIKGEDDDEI